MIEQAPPPPRSHKSLKTKKLLAVARKRNRPLPNWIRMRTDNTIRYNGACSQRQRGRARSQDESGMVCRCRRGLARWHQRAAEWAVGSAVDGGHAAHSRARAHVCVQNFSPPVQTDNPPHTPHPSTAKRRHWRRTKLGI